MRLPPRGARRRQRPRGPRRHRRDKGAAAASSRIKAAAVRQSRHELGGTVEGVGDRADAVDAFGRVASSSTRRDPRDTASQHAGLIARSLRRTPERRLQVTSPAWGRMRGGRIGRIITHSPRRAFGKSAGTTGRQDGPRGFTNRCCVEGAKYDIKANASLRSPRRGDRDRGRSALVGPEFVAPLVHYLAKE